MRVTAILLSVASIASASEQPRIDGQVPQDDVHAIIAAIRTATADRIVFIRATPSRDRVGVRTESGPDAGCHYLVERSSGKWHVGPKSCWTHTAPAEQNADKRWPRVGRPSEISDSDFSEIKSAVAKFTHDEIRTMEVVANSPLSVQVHTASTHVVTEGDFTLQKVGGRWKVSKQLQWIH